MYYCITLPKTQIIHPIALLVVQEVLLYFHCFQHKQVAIKSKLLLSTSFGVFIKNYTIGCKLLYSFQFYWVDKVIEIFFREIGNYINRAKWSSTFYQSLVAIQKLKLSKQLKGHDGCVNSLDFNKTGDLITSGSDDYRICLWDWSRGKCILKHNSAHTRNIFQVILFLFIQIKICCILRAGLT